MFWFMVTVTILSTALVAIIGAAFLTIYVHERQTVRPDLSTTSASRPTLDNHPHPNTV